MLSAKRQTFADEFAVSHNGALAARVAGYRAASAKVTASRLLTDANVRAAVALREMDAEKVLGMTRERVLRALQDAFDLARQQANPLAMIAACREIARMCGYYVQERKPVALDGGPGARFEQLSDQALMAIVKGGECRVV